MLKFAHMPSWLVWSLLVALVATRVSGVHLHLCFDGQQPQASVQTGQAGLDEFDGSTNHQEKDKDLSILSDALVKNMGNKTLSPMLFVAAVLLFILNLPGKVGFSSGFSRPVIPHASGFHLRPPLRGPPR